MGAFRSAGAFPIPTPRSIPCRMVILTTSHCFSPPQRLDPTRQAVRTALPPPHHSLPCSHHLGYRPKNTTHYQATSFPPFPANFARNGHGGHLEKPVTSTDGIGPRRVQFPRVRKSPPLHPVAGSITDLDVMMRYCDFSTNWVFPVSSP